MGIGQGEIGAGFQRHRFGGQVDVGRMNAGHLVQGLFHAQDTAGTGHTQHRKAQGLAGSGRSETGHDADSFIGVVKSASAFPSLEGQALFWKK
ncbi:hypothetical protein D3C86_1963900 [compost metagenome]